MKYSIVCYLQAAVGDHAFIVKPHWFFQNKHDVFIGETSFIYDLFCVRVWNERSNGVRVLNVRLVTLFQFNVDYSIYGSDYSDDKLHN